MKHSLKHIKNYIFKSFRVATIFIFGLVTLYAPLTNALSKISTTTSWVITFLSALFTVLAIFFPKLKMSIDRKILLLAYFFLLGVILIVYQSWPTNIMLLSLLYIAFVPSVLLTGRWTYIIYNLILILVNYHLVFNIATRSRAVDGTIIPIENMFFVNKITSVILFIIGFIITYFVRRSIKTIFEQLSESLDEADKQKQEVLSLNRTLEEKVINRTKELELTLENLQNTQERLMDKETLLSFSKFTNKINHMINTPLGIAYTSSSYLNKVLNDIEVYLESNNISKTMLLTQIDESKNCNQTIQSSINKSILTLEEMKRFSTYHKIDNAIIYNSVKLLTYNLKQNAKYSSINLQFEYQNIIKIQMHETILNRILFSLIENAVDFNPEQELTIKISFSKLNEKTKIIVEDDGQGIKEQDYDSVFSPYYSTSPHKIGMGLFIIKTIIYETYKGKFYLDKDYKKGCRFIIEIEDHGTYDAAKT